MQEEKKGFTIQIFTNDEGEAHFKSLEHFCSKLTVKQNPYHSVYNDVYLGVNMEFLFYDIDDSFKEFMKQVKSIRCLFFFSHINRMSLHCPYDNECSSCRFFWNLRMY